MRQTIPRRRTGFNAGALIPGSVSTMVSVTDSAADEAKPNTIASPSFQNLLECDASSDYETDLEEDFPGICDDYLLFKKLAAVFDRVLPVAAKCF